MLSLAIRRLCTSSLWPLLLSSGASTTLSHCNPVSWPVHQLGCSYFLMRLLPPSCGPCRHHAAPAALMQPLPPLCGPCRPHAAPATLMWPLLPSCGPCRPHAAPASEAHEAWQSAGFVSVRYLFFYILGPSSPAESAAAESGGATVAARNPLPSAVVYPPTLWGKSARGLPI
jgi:hypothetical protein